MMGSASFRFPGSSAFHFEVSCPNERPLLNILRRFVTNVAEEMGFAPEDVAKIEMAVDEACTNAIIHGAGEVQASQQSGRGIALKLNMSSDELTIQIRDHGDGFRKKQSSFPTIEDYQNDRRENYHGLGILIMKEFMDHVEFADHPERGTMVTLRKFLKQTAPPKPGAQQETGPGE